MAPRASSGRRLIRSPSAWSQSGPAAAGAAAASFLSIAAAAEGLGWPKSWPWALGLKFPLNKNKCEKKKILPSKMLALTSLSPRPARPSPSPATPPHRRPPPPCGRIRPTSAVSTAASDGGGAADDYHSTIRSLNSHGRRHVPRKSLGQNYMLNARVNEELVAAAGVEEGDVVLEIGPGTGSLTAALLAAGATVVAVEKDKHMATLVRDRFGSTEQLKVIEEDITKFHVHSHFLPILEEKSRGTKKYAKVVSNLPFNVSTEVVKQILPMGDVFSVMVLMLQDEAALRLANASIQTPEYRPINVFVNFYSEPEYKFKVERANFFPQPTVDGGVIRFKIKDAGEYPPVSSNKSFFSMVNSAFNGKRKMLRKSLQHLYSSADIEAALTNIGLPPTARPSELMMDDFVRLHNYLGNV
ncbi:ribosomal RNA small subunit methyltransferase, chloroplastic [Triticum aestivum]|nr:ribosomal RNA small subunit methyltransferase, chloroplastic-like [Triticum aestivum]XP_044418214.1 ribosomal RNA small subunit methyltransferase, chloroplastic-like [Triticum aestivum]